MKIGTDSFRLVSPTDLKSGDLAFFCQTQLWGLVGSINGFFPVVFLEQSDDWRVSQTSDIEGYALKVSNWRIKIDPRSAEKPDSSNTTLLSLTDFEGGFGVYGLSPDGSRQLHCPLVDGVDSSVIRMVYKSWQVVVQDGDHEEVVFEFAPV